MIRSLFRKSSTTALNDLRRVYLAQLDGSLGHDLCDVLSRERRTWGRVLDAFDIDAARGLAANFDAIAALVDECRKRSASFDYSGIVIPALINASGFLPEEREELESYLASLGSDPAPARQVGAQRGIAMALKLAGVV